MDPQNRRRLENEQIEYAALVQENDVPELHKKLFRQSRPIHAVHHSESSCNLNMADKCHHTLQAGIGRAADLITQSSLKSLQKANSILPSFPLRSSSLKTVDQTQSSEMGITSRIPGLHKMECDCPKAFSINIGGLDIQRTTSNQVSASENFDAEERDASEPKTAHQGKPAGFAALAVCNVCTCCWHQFLVFIDVLPVDYMMDYMPGFLGYAEAPGLKQLLDRVPSGFEIDLLMVDGNGTLHPRRCGSAVQISMLTGIPSIGVAKSLACVDGVPQEKTVKAALKSESRGVYQALTCLTGDEIGRALVTKAGVKPIYVSVGNKISLHTATEIVLNTALFRQPSPIRFADQLCRQAARDWLASDASSPTLNS